MDPLALVAAISVMLTVLATMLAFYGNAMPQSSAVRGRLQGLMSGTQVVETTGPVALRQRAKGKGPIATIIGENLGERLAQQLERADMTLQPSEYIVLRFAVAAAGFMVPVFIPGGVMGIIIGIVAAVIGYNLPKIYMNRRRNARIAKLEAQLPETLTMVSNALKAGFGLLQALGVAAEQMQHPISTELSRAIHEMNVGSSVEEAMNALNERAQSPDLDIVVTAILVQRSVGGNLGEILDNVAETMRERIRIRGEIRTLTAQQKLSGVVVGMLPVAVGGLFAIISPGYINPLFTTLMGQMMLGVAVVLEVIGVMVIQRILNIEV